MPSTPLRSTNINCFVAGAKRGSRGCMGDGSAGSWGAGTLLTPRQASLRRGQLTCTDQRAGPGEAGRTRNTGAPRGYRTWMLRGLHASNVRGCSAPRGFTAPLQGCLSIPSLQLPHSGGHRPTPEGKSSKGYLPQSRCHGAIKCPDLPRRAAAKRHPEGLSPVAGASPSFRQQLTGRYVGTLLLLAFAWPMSCMWGH